ncbi:MULTISPECIES: two-partner secretion domain-containing protein [unclassified Calothrix]|uniref:two-partner secretion domain-containing protein n=1 Tax=unclassified Calothrix TaxID=2619626 RepID=UPI0018EFA50A|nr:filamentous hemagglutinin N-terminal domain-containing protein [Calothrix sp. FACHB-1219]
MSVVTIETLAQFLLIPIITSNPTLAQIVPDGTLGNESSRVTGDVTIKGGAADLIEGGALRGSSLFHSFTEFNINEGKRAYFGNPTGVENIFSRVTGNNVSNILGTLGVNGSANLFLLNPNGILFGKNAQLDIQGSFLATTANSFQFPDGSEFSATNPQAAPLLTMSVPVGVQYGSQPTASISNEGNLETGKDLTLSAGNLDLQGQLQAGGNLTLQAQDTLKVRDSVSNPFIAAAGGKLVVQGNQQVDIFALNHPNSGFFSGGDMVLRSSNAVGGDAHYWAGGNFTIEQLDGDLGNLLSPKDPVIRASGDVSFGSYKGASLHILAGGSVTIEGNVEITGEDTSNFLKETITLSDGTKLEIDGSNKPTLDIRAGVSSGAIGIPIFISNPPIGNSGTIPTTTNTPTDANITINGGIYNTSGAESNSGQIFITNQYKPNNELAGDITTGLISTYGDVTIDSRGDIDTQGEINTTAQKDKIGGDVTIQAVDDIHVANITATSINDNANDSNKYFSTIYINSTEGSVYLDNSTLSNSNTGSGYAGDIIIKASNEISLFNKSEISSQGNYGRIFINANTLTLNNSSITTKTEKGVAGDINITVQDFLLLRDRSNIIATGVEGDGGNIKINENAKAGFVIAVPSEDSDILANGVGGNGGKIKISANRIIGFKNSQNRGKLDLNNIDQNRISDISASSDIGQDGEISLDTLSIDPSQGLVALPTDLTDASGLIAQGCGAGGGGSVAKGQSEFVITGRGGLPPSPDDALSAGAVSASWVNRDTDTSSNNNEKDSVKAANVMEFSSGGTKPLVEAVGMVRNSNGDIVLTAKPTTATQLQSRLSSAFCSVK